MRGMFRFYFIDESVLVRWGDWSEVVESGSGGGFSFRFGVALSGFVFGRISVFFEFFFSGVGGECFGSINRVGSFGSFSGGVFLVFIVVF